MASWKDGLKDREGTVTQLACVMMSSQIPPYSAEVLEEARKTARKFEVGFVSRSKSAKEYASKVAAKKGDLIKKILNGKILVFVLYCKLNTSDSSFIVQCWVIEYF